MLSNEFFNKYDKLTTLISSECPHWGHMLPFEGKNRFSCKNKVFYGVFTKPPYH
jgi:hypothetical protein